MVRVHARPVFFEMFFLIAVEIRGWRSQPDFAGV